MTEYKLYLLGRIGVEQNGQSIPGIRSQKTLALLGYIAVIARPVSRTALADLFWGDEPPKRARRELRRVLHNLTSLLPGCLHTDRQRVELASPSVLWVDACQFRAHVTAGDEASLTQAADLYQDELMAGLHLASCPVFETWLLGEREVFRQEALGVYERLLTLHSQRAEYQAAVALAQSCLAIAPWREETHRRLMLFLARTGQFSAALRQYKQCQAILAEEIDVRPSPATVRLAERVRQARVARRHVLPPDSTPFVGRHEALSSLRRYLADPNVRLITITGLGGMGKTRLALAAAREAAGDEVTLFLNGICWVPLTGTETANQLPAMLARRLGLDPHNQQAPEAQLLGYLGDREMLLLLDNYEHLLPHTELLSLILQKAPEVKLLVTSRERLDLQAEVVIIVDGLACPADGMTIDNPEVARQFASVRFVETYACRLDSGFQLAGNVANVVELCRLVKGMPLALELAVSWLPSLGWAAILAALRQDLDLLSNTRPDLPVRHRSWQAVFNHSWARLGPGERQMLADLSPFLDDLGLDAVLALGGDSQAVLRRLVNKSLIHRTSGDRYTMHILLRQFIASVAAPVPAERRSLERRFANFYATFLLAREDSLVALEQAETIAEIMMELPNVRRAWQHLLEQSQWETIDQIIWPMALYFTILGWYREGEAWFSQAVSRLGEVDRKVVLGRCLLWQSFFTLQMGLLRAAQVCWRHCQMHQVYFQLDQDRGWYEIVAGEMALRAPHNDATAEDVAASHFRRALQYIGSNRQPWLRAYALTSLGQVVPMEEAELQLRDAQVLCHANENHWGEFLALSALGDLAYHSGRLDEARSHFEAAEKATAHFASSWARGATRYRLGRLVEHRRSPRAALDHYDRALELLWESGDLYLATEVLRAVIRTSLKSGNIERAHFLASRNLALAQELGDPLVVAEQTHYLGHVLLAAGEYSAARYNYRQALAQFEDVDAAEAAWAMYGIGQAAFYEGAFALAEEHLRRSLTLFQQLDSHVGAATAAGGLARLYLQQGAIAEALRFYGVALPSWQETNDEVGIGLYLTGMVKIKSGVVSCSDRVPVLAAAQRLIDQGLGEPLAPAGRQILEDQIAIARRELEEDEFVATWKRGAALSTLDCISLVQAWKWPY